MENQKNHKILLIGSNSESISIIEHSLDYLDVPFEKKEKIDLDSSLSELGYTLLILSEMLASPGPLEICRAIREIDPFIFISYFTNCDNPIERVLAYELGVDQFIRLPASEVEIRARLRSQLRRANSLFELNQIHLPGIVHVNELEIDTLKKEASIGNKTIQLTSSEYRILEYLALSSGQTLSRSTIAHKLWGYDSDVYEENVKYHISRIRRKIERDPHNPLYIKTIRGIGYRMLEADEIIAT